MILAREDVETWPAAVPGCRVSLDGCNYRAFVPLATPLGTINIERGFVFAHAGYMDLWTLKPGNAAGLTCCQAEDLQNAESLLSKRIDVILSTVAPSDVHARRVGAEAKSKTPSGLWPSDHAGVLAWFRF